MVCDALLKIKAARLTCEINWPMVDFPEPGPPKNTYLLKILGVCALMLELCS